MKDFLENIVKNIVEQPDSVVVTEVEDNGKVNLHIKVDDADMGRVIGKEGKVINSIRMIMRVIAIRQKVKIRVDVEDSRPKPTQEPVAQPAAPVAAPMEMSAEPVEAPQAPVEMPTPAVEPAPAVEPTQEVQATAADFVGQPQSETPQQTTVLDNSN